MENKQNQTNNYKNNKNKLNLPLEAFFDIINAANTSDMIINDDNTIAKYEKMKLQLKKYFIKIMSSSAIIYAFAGKNFIKMFVEFKNKMSTEQDKDEKIRQLEEQLFNQGQQLEQRDAQIEQRDAQIEQQRQRIANLVLFIIDNHLSTENVGTNISSTAANSGSSINIVNTWSMNPQQFSDYGQVQMTSQALTTQPISSQNVQSGASLVNTFGGSSARQQKNRMTKDYEAILNEYLVQDYLTRHDIEEIRKKINYQLEAPYIRNWFNKKKREGRGGGEE